MIDRDQLREAMEWWNSGRKRGEILASERLIALVEAARLVVDPDTLILRKQKNGEWPERVLKVGDRFDMKIYREDRPDQPSCLADALDALLEGQPK